MTLKITKIGGKTTDRPLPPRLAHYTTLAGLQGILEKGEMWASNVSFLNDRRELQYGLEASVQAVKALTTVPKTSPWLKALKRAAAKLQDGDLPNTYAVCFCEESDVLSQWRGYSGGEQGVALNFDRKALAERMKTDKASLYPIVYGNIKTSTKISEALERELKELTASEAAQAEEMTDADRNKAAQRAISRLLPQFKHYGFREEKELRFVVQQANVRTAVCFRPVANVLVPYLALIGDGDLLPLQSIVVGPGRDQDLTKHSLEIFLRHCGYEDVAIRKSTVPFRT